MASTPRSAPKAEIFRFGAFEANARTGKLLKRGVRIRLEPRGFEVLLILLRSPGNTISRAEIIRDIWHRDSDPEDFYDHLAQAVAKIRRALGDSSVNPRYVETVQGSGYVFIALVEAIPIDGSSPAELKVAPPTGEISDLSSGDELPANGVVQSVSSDVGAVSLDAKRREAEAPQRVWKGGFHGGEGGICAAISLSYGIMVGLALPAEVAYRWPEFHDWAIPVSLGAGIGSALLAGISLRVLRRVRVTAKHFDARAIAPPGVLCLWTVVLALTVAPWLPNEPIVQANWQTLTAKVGFAKSLLEALGLPLLSLVPVQAVFALRQMIGSGDIAPVRNVLSSRSSLAMVGGTLIPGPMFSVIAYAVVTFWWLNTQAHLLENLKIASYYPLFVELAAARASAGLITLLVVVLWYVLRWHQLVSSVQSSYKSP